MKISVTPSRRPFPGRPPKNPELYEARWWAALPRPCPECHSPAGVKCINLARSHARSGVAYETRSPHRSRRPQ